MMDMRKLCQPRIIINKECEHDWRPKGVHWNNNTKDQSDAIQWVFVCVKHQCIIYGMHLLHPKVNPFVGLG